MKICVVGAGAIGGYLAVHLSKVGHTVSVIARGLHLIAIKSYGLKLVEQQTEVTVESLIATDVIEDIGKQDLVLLALKTHQIEQVVDSLPSLMRKDTVMVTLQNGIPWWYFQKHSGDYEGSIVRTVDPSGTLFKRIDPHCLIGCIAYPAATVMDPGRIMHIEGNRFPVGELDGSESKRVQMIANLFTEAGFKSRVLSDIRSEIWLKLWGNLTFNPISALTHSTLVDICQFPKTRKLATMMMSEAQEVAEKLGAKFRVPLEKRIAGAEGVGSHKTSMLQDLEAGKPMEIEGLLGVVIELAEMTRIEVPTLRAVYACVSLLDHTTQREGIYVRGQTLAE